MAEQGAAVYIGDPRAPGQRHREFEFFTEEADDVGESESAGHRESMRLRPPDHHRIGTERERNKYISDMP